MSALKYICKNNIVFKCFNQLNQTTPQTNKKKT